MTPCGEGCCISRSYYCYDFVIKDFLILPPGFNIIEKVGICNSMEDACKPLKGGWEWNNNYQPIISIGVRPCEFSCAGFGG